MESNWDFRKDINGKPGFFPAVSNCISKESSWDFSDDAKGTRICTVLLVQ
jgi:hypothetical protein